MPQGQGDATAARQRMAARRRAEGDKQKKRAAKGERLKAINREIRSMQSSGAAKIRPNKLKELQDEGLRLASELRAMRRAR